MDLFIYLLLNCLFCFFLSIKLLFFNVFRNLQGVEDIKYNIKRHIKSLKHCVSCELPPAYSLYALKYLIWMIDVAGFGNQPLFI